MDMPVKIFIIVLLFILTATGFFSSNLFVNLKYIAIPVIVLLLIFDSLFIVPQQEVFVIERPGKYVRHFK